MKKKKILVAANWKMNPATPDEARAVFSASVRGAKKCPRITLALCPPALYAGLFRKPAGRNVFLGVQNVFWERGGSYTGEISAPMAHSAGAAYAIVGHSERRGMGETDETVARKTLAVMEASLSPIVCIGEAERDGEGVYFNFLKNQLRTSLAGLRPRHLSSLVIAYEPVWAIGKDFKDAMKPAQVRETALFVKKVLADMFTADIAEKVPVLYGGSVNFENAGSLVAEGGVDGLLVGRQSLDVKNFPRLLSILNAL